MNYSIAISFIIGGMLLISLMAWNARVNQHSGMVTMNQITKQRVEAIGVILDSDMRNIGQGVASNQITVADSNRITFSYFNINSEFQSITWHFDHATAVPETFNPNDRMLTRTVNGVTTEIRFGVVQFRLTYLDSVGVATANIPSIRQIRAEVLVESEAPYGNEYSRSYWETVVTPRTLQF